MIAESLKQRRIGEKKISKYNKLPFELSVQTGAFALSKYYCGIKVSIKPVSTTVLTAELPHGYAVYRLRKLIPTQWLPEAWM